MHSPFLARVLGCRLGGITPGGNRAPAGLTVSDWVRWQGQACQTDAGVWAL